MKTLKQFFCKKPTASLCGILDGGYFVVLGENDPLAHLITK